MNKILTAILLVALIAFWWNAAAPPDHHPVPGKITFDGQAVENALRVDQSEAFQEQLELLPSDLPGHDDIIFMEKDGTALVSAMDGRIWSYNLKSHEVTPFVDPPLMAAGMHESPRNHTVIYFCSSYLWGEDYPENERVGLYALDTTTRSIQPVVLYVPDTELSGEKIWSLDDDSAPVLQSQTIDSSSVAYRPLAFCNDLEISADGNRIYFSEPFAYEGASMGGGTVPEAISFHGNGRIWMHDLMTGATRLVAEGLFFPDGILYDLHDSGSKERSIITSLTPGFSIARIYVAGPKAGTREIIHEGLGGMCDGLDRDRAGNIWCAVFTQRTDFLTWIHENPWIKHLLLRLPLNWIPQPAATGVLALSPDASEFLYSASYEGPKARLIASVIPGPDDFLYVTPFSREHRGAVILPNPLLGSKKGHK